jgi:MoxR-like ATPase
MSLAEIRRDAVARSLEELAGQLTSARQKALEPQRVSNLAAQVRSGAPHAGQEAQALANTLASRTSPDGESLYDRLHWRLLDAAACAPAPDSPDPKICGEVCSTLREIRHAVDAATSAFVRTTPFATTAGVQLDVKDLLIVGAIAHADVLLVGRTGGGKTRLATLIMKALFGPDGFYSKTTLPSMSPSDFLDIDFGVMKSGGLLSAARSAKALSLPGLIVNEANRAPGLVQAMLIPLLDREFEVEGTPVPVGVQMEGGERYHYRILTVNEGTEYHIEAFDAALRDRAVLQIPLDVFPQSEADVSALLGQVSSPASMPETPGPERAASWAKTAAKVVKVFQLVRTFLAGLSNCVRSITGYKDGILLVPATFCAGCHHQAGAASFGGQGLCGHIRAPSPRALFNLLRVSQAVALVRSAKEEANATQGAESSPAIEVTLDDVTSVAPFVLRGKLGLDPQWVVNAAPLSGSAPMAMARFAGCEWEAIRHIFTDLKRRFDAFVCSDAYWVFDTLRCGGQPEPAAARARLAWHAQTCEPCAGNPLRLRCGR